MNTKVGAFSSLGKGKYAVTIRDKVLVQVVKGDITKERTEAVTNAANSRLWLGTGVAGAIRAAGGPSIQEECEEYVKANGEVPVGGCGWTGAGDMEAKFVLHAVGPRYDEYEPAVSELLLTSCIINTLERAKELKVRSLSIPAISSGVFGFPRASCASIILQTCAKWVTSQDPGPLGRIRLCNFDT